MRKVVNEGFFSPENLERMKRGETIRVEAPNVPNPQSDDIPEPDAEAPASEPEPEYNVGRRRMIKAARNSGNVQSLFPKQVDFMRKYFPELKDVSQEYPELEKKFRSYYIDDDGTISINYMVASDKSSPMKKNAPYKTFDDRLLNAAVNAGVFIDTFFGNVRIATSLSTLPLNFPREIVGMLDIEFAPNINTTKNFPKLAPSTKLTFKEVSLSDNDIASILPSPSANKTGENYTLNDVDTFYSHMRLSHPELSYGDPKEQNTYHLYSLHSPFKSQPLYFGKCDELVITADDIEFFNKTGITKVMIMGNVSFGDLSDAYGYIGDMFVKVAGDAAFENSKDELPDVVMKNVKVGGKSTFNEVSSSENDEFTMKDIEKFMTKHFPRIRFSNKGGMNTYDVQDGNRLVITCKTLVLGNDKLTELSKEDSDVVIDTVLGNVYAKPTTTCTQLPFSFPKNIDGNLVIIYGKNFKYVTNFPETVSGETTVASVDGVSYPVEKRIRDMYKKIEVNSNAAEESLKNEIAERIALGESFIANEFGPLNEAFSSDILRKLVETGSASKHNKEVFRKIGKEALVEWDKITDDIIEVVSGPDALRTFLEGDKRLNRERGLYGLVIFTDTKDEIQLVYKASGELVYASPEISEYIRSDYASLLKEYLYKIGFGTKARTKEKTKDTFRGYLNRKALELIGYIEAIAINEPPYPNDFRITENMINNSAFAGATGVEIPSDIYSKGFDDLDVVSWAKDFIVRVKAYMRSFEDKDIISMCIPTKRKDAKRYEGTGRARRTFSRSSDPFSTIVDKNRDDILSTVVDYWDENDINFGYAFFNNEITAQLIEYSFNVESSDFGTQDMLYDAVKDKKIGESALISMSFKGEVGLGGKSKFRYGITNEQVKSLMGYCKTMIYIHSMSDSIDRYDDVEKDMGRRQSPSERMRNFNAADQNKHITRVRNERATAKYGDNRDFSHEEFRDFRESLERSLRNLDNQKSALEFMQDDATIDSRLRNFSVTVNEYIDEMISAIKVGFRMDVRSSPKGGFKTFFTSLRTYANDLTNLVKYFIDAVNDDNIEMASQVFFDMMQKFDENKMTKTLFRVSNYED